MASYSKNDVLLVQYPFSDLSATKVRPAVVVNAKFIPDRLDYVTVIQF